MLTMKEAIEILRNLSDPETLPYTFTEEDASELEEVALFLESLDTGDEEE